MHCQVIFIELVTITMSAYTENNYYDNNTTNTYYLFVDTETTGVPTNHYSDWSQCRLIQLGMVVKDQRQETVYENCLVVRFDGTNHSTQESYSIHGISDDSRIDATPGRLVCEEFIRTALRCDVLVSHGNAFDFGVIFRECLLYNLDISCLIGKTVIDTKQSEHYRGYNENLRQTVLRINPEWVCDSDFCANRAHNALYDAYLCAELFYHSHAPRMYDSVEHLINYLNNNRYYDGLDDIRSRLRHNVIEIRGAINEHTDDYNNQRSVTADYDSDYDSNDDDTSYDGYEVIEEEDFETDPEWNYYLYEEEDYSDGYYYEDYAGSCNARCGESPSTFDTSSCSLRGNGFSYRNLSHHEPEDYT